MFRHSIQDKILRNRNEEDKNSMRSNKLNGNEVYDPNQNKCYKVNGVINNNHQIITNGNNGNHGPPMMRDRYQQHPALTAIINEAQGIKFRGKIILTIICVHYCFKLSSFI